MGMIGRIRRLQSRKKKSVREIARITGLSRNTISKWLHGEVDGPPKYRRSEQPSKLTAFHDVLRQALKAYRRPSSSSSIWRCVPGARRTLRGARNCASA